MARIDVRNGYPFDLTQLNLNALYEGYVVAQTTTAFAVSYGGGSSDTFRGFGFTYNALNEPTTGVATSYQGMRYGHVSFTVTGISVPTTSLVAVAQTGSNSDDLSLFRSILGGADTFNGSFANDKLAGYGGNDVLRGGKGNDTIYGHDGNDVLVGGWGRDALVGGAGSDRFDFNSKGESLVTSADLIRDFRRGYDKIDLQTIDADQNGTAGNQAFKFIGSKPFTGTDGELRFSSGMVYGDVNGDRVADFAVRVYGLTVLAASDFVL